MRFVEEALREEDFEDGLEGMKFEGTSFQWEVIVPVCWDLIGDMDVGSGELEYLLRLFPYKLGLGVRCLEVLLTSPHTKTDWTSFTIIMQSASQGSRTDPPHQKP